MTVPLIIGSGSLLGRYLIKIAPMPFASTFHDKSPYPGYKLDISDKEQVNTVFEKLKPDVVVNCAFEGDVDRTQKEPVLVKKSNIDGVINVVSNCDKYNIKYIHLSTNAVFDGTNAPYHEKSERHAVNKYGEIKIEAENEATQCEKWTIIRPILLYGWPWKTGRDNWAVKIINNCRQGKKSYMVNDTVTQPTHAVCVAKNIWKIILDENGFNTDFCNDIIHIAAPDQTNLYQFANSICLAFGLDKKLIEEVDSEYFGIAKRPIDTTYDLTKAKSLKLTCMGITDGLDTMALEQ